MFAKRQFDAKFEKLMIANAANDPRLFEAARLMIFKLSEPEVILVAHTIAKVADYWGIDPDATRQAIELSAIDFIR